MQLNMIHKYNGYFVFFVHFQSRVVFGGVAFTLLNAGLRPSNCVCVTICGPYKFNCDEKWYKGEMITLNAKN